jgi:hypothetical protein
MVKEALIIERKIAIKKSFIYKGLPLFQVIKEKNIVKNRNTLVTDRHIQTRDGS